MFPGDRAEERSVKQLVLASSNPGKLREFEELLAPLGIEVVPQARLGVPEADEPHYTFVENALAKARNASRHARLPALADDSGICAVALGGEPGVHSARFAGDPRSDERNNERLVALLKDKAKLTRVLTYHVVPGKVMAADVAKLSEAKTVEGQSVKIDTSAGVKIDGANVIKADVAASNGVIHMIDSVILPR